ncbi:MAG TPA: phage holin family protein [Acidimicrobiia bacterium]
MRHIIIRILINMLALWIAAGILSGVELEGDFWRILLVAAIFGVINAVIKPVVQLLALPLIVLSLGLVLIVINALMLLITDALTTALAIENFGWALLGAIVISIVSWGASMLIPE